MDTWKQSFWRNLGIKDNMSKMKFRHEMCAIRHFKTVVKFIETFNNFIMAADDSGMVGIFLISETDLCNDDDTLKTISIQTPGVEFFHCYAHT